MKKLFTILLMALLLFVGCTKVEDMSFKAVSQDREIAFTVGNSNTPVTKAIVDTTAMVDNFGVYGYVVPGDFSVNGGYLMKNAEYDKDGNAVSGSYYWPKSDNYKGIDFIFTAYSQFESAPTWENDTLKLVVPTLTQALIDNEDDFDDVLWAQTKYDYHQNSLGDHERVVLEFKHALSWLQFRGEVINPNIKWVKVKQISFGEYRDSVAGVAPIPEVPYQPAVYDTTDTWYNVKIGANYTLIVRQGPQASHRLTATSEDIPDFTISKSDIDYINSMFVLEGYENGEAWPTSSNIIKMRQSDISNIDDAYKTTHADGNGTFFNAYKWLKDKYPELNTSSVSLNNWTSDFVPVSKVIAHIDSVYNSTQKKTYYRAWFFDYANTSTPTQYKPNSVPQYTVVEVSPEVPYQPAVPGVDPVPAHGSVGLYVDGTLCLPTKDTLTTTPLAVYGTQKDTTLNYVKAQVDTIFTNDHIILGNSLVVPQPVPEKITVVFDICIVNPTGDEVVFTDRKITRTINAGKDADEDATYVASWGASNKYIYNFRFDGDVLDFTTSVLGWTLIGTDYHVWDY